MANEKTGTTPPKQQNRGFNIFMTIVILLAALGISFTVLMSAFWFPPFPISATAIMIIFGCGMIISAYRHSDVKSAQAKIQSDEKYKIDPHWDL